MENYDINKFFLVVSGSASFVAILYQSARKEALNK